MPDKQATDTYTNASTNVPDQTRGHRQTRRPQVCRYLPNGKSLSDDLDNDAHGHTYMTSDLELPSQPMTTSTVSTTPPSNQHGNRNQSTWELRNQK